MAGRDPAADYGSGHLAGTRDCCGQGRCGTRGQVSWSVITNRSSLEVGGCVGAHLLRVSRPLIATEVLLARPSSSPFNTTVIPSSASSAWLVAFPGEGIQVTVVRRRADLSTKRHTYALHKSHTTHRHRQSSKPGFLACHCLKSAHSFSSVSASTQGECARRVGVLRSPPPPPPPPQPLPLPFTHTVVSNLVCL